MKLLFGLLPAWLPVVALAAIVEPPYAQGQSAVMFAWDANAETNVAGYRLLSGPASRVYTTTNTISGRTTTIGTVSNVPPGKVFFALVAFDGSGLESDFSNEVSWTNRFATPKNFRLVGTMQASVSPTGPWKDLATVDVKLPPAPEAQQFYRTRLLLEEEK